MEKQKVWMQSITDILEIVAKMLQKNTSSVSTSIDQIPKFLVTYLL
jgi:hypothetical protein